VFVVVEGSAVDDCDEFQIVNGQNELPGRKKLVV
jgi:hypothetical protein